MKNVEVSLSKNKLKKLLATGVAFATCLSLCTPALLHASENADVEEKVVYSASGEPTNDPTITPSGDVSNDATGDTDDEVVPTKDAVEPSGDPVEQPDEEVTSDPQDQASGDATSDQVVKEYIHVTGDIQTEDAVDLIKNEEVKEPSINVEKNDQKITKDIFAAAKETGKPLKITVMGTVGTAYTIQFAKIENANIDFDLKVDINNVSKVLNTEVPKGTNIVEFNFAYHGDLPGTAQVIAPINGLGIKDGNVFVYYVNENTNKLELVSKDATVKNSVVTFSITHCSKYVVSDKALVEETKEPEKEPEKPLTPTTPTKPAKPEKPSTTKPADKDSTIKDTSTTTTNVIPMLAGIAMLAGAAVIVLRKKES